MTSRCLLPSVPRNVARSIRRAEPSHQRRLSGHTQRIAGSSAQPTANIAAPSMVKISKAVAVLNAQPKIVCRWREPKSTRQVFSPRGSLLAVPWNIDETATKLMVTGSVRYRSSLRPLLSRSRLSASFRASSLVLLAGSYSGAARPVPNPAFEGSCAKSRAAPSTLR